jgi:hypothetical protein
MSCERKPTMKKRATQLKMGSKLLGKTVPQWNVTRKVKLSWAEIETQKLNDFDCAKFIINSALYVYILRN